MKACRISGVIPPLILKPGTRWRSDQRHAPVALTILNKDRCSLNRRLIWPLSWSGRYVGQKTLYLILNIVHLLYI